MTKKAKNTKLPLKKKSVRVLNETTLRSVAGGYGVAVANPSIRPTVSVAQSSAIGINDAGSGNVAESLARKGGATSAPTGSTASHMPDSQGGYGAP